MKKLNELAIKSREVDLENGFFFVEFFNGDSLQCCLVSNRGNWDESAYYLNQIEVGNSGYYSGVCLDCNNWAVGQDGETEHIELFLIEQARMIGVEIVG